MANSPNQAPAVRTGFLNFCKPAGLTSMDALRRIKVITGQKQKVGHAGTMDPLAHGVLPICFGQATRLMEHVVGGIKRYTVTIKLGEITSTFDAEGEAIRSGDPTGITVADVTAVLPRFIGTVMQTPPMYSAIKINGQRLYKLARAGIEVEREARPVEITAIEIIDLSLPVLVINVHCGRGVYMRSLAHDLGIALGCGGYVTDLVRTYSGGFRLEDSVTLELLEQANAQDPGRWLQYLQPVDSVLRDLRAVKVSPQAEQYLSNGQPVGMGRAAMEADYLEQFRLYSANGRFLALAKCDRSTNTWKPVRVFRGDAPSPYALDETERQVSGNMGPLTQI
jgi:tRNA pseudouridine55 synthase